MGLVPFFQSSPASPAFNAQIVCAPSQMGSTDLLVQLLRDAAVPDAHHMFRTKVALTARIVRKRESAGAVALGPNVVEDVDEPVNVEPGHCILFRSSFESGAEGTYVLTT